MDKSDLNTDTLTVDQLLSEIAVLKKKFNVIVDHTESVETWILPDQTIAFISPGIEKITGYPAADFIKDPGLFNKIIHPDDFQEYRQLYSGNHENGLPAEIDRRIVCRSGEIRWIQTRMTKIYDGNGIYNGFRSSSIDITSRKTAELKLHKAYAQLKELEEKYQIVADNTYDMERWVLPDDTLVYISPSCENITGYSREEFMENPGLLMKIIHPDDHEWFDRLRHQAFFTDSCMSTDVRIMTKKGETRWLGIVSQKVVDIEGKSLGIRTSSRDITDQKELEEKLAVSRNLYSSIVEEQIDLIIRLLNDGTCTYLNNAFVSFFGLEKEEILGKNLREWSAKEENDKILQFNDLLNADQSFKRVVLDYHFKDGSKKYIEWISQGVFNGAGQIIEHQIIGRDVTESVIYRNQLQLSEARYKAVVESQNEMIIRHQLDSTITYVNEAFVKFTNSEAADLIGKKWFDLVDLQTIKTTKLLMKSLSEECPSVTHIMINKRSDGVDRWISWTSTGIFDHLGNLSDLQVVGHDITSLKKAEKSLEDALAEVNALKSKLEQENLYLRDKFIPLKSLEGIISDSPLMHDVLEKVKQVAGTDAPVLLFGETGTGKELIAQAIHNASPRRKRLMITLNCAALPPSLIESELFGRERGAYTGALSSQIGRFELANNSTIFLDEIGELPLEIQVKLLRVLQFGEFQVLGSPETKKVNVRIIAATNKDLTKAQADGTFRQDLYYRLNVFPISLPPLRERKEDIPQLTWTFIDEITVKIGKRIEKISTSSMNRMLKYNWPGNIRELRNVIEYSIIISHHPVLEIMIKDQGTEDHGENHLDKDQKKHIEKILNQTGWRIRGKGGAAEKLGLKESTLRFRMKKLGLHRPSPPI